MLLLNELKANEPVQLTFVCRKRKKEIVSADFRCFDSVFPVYVYIYNEWIWMRIVEFLYKSFERELDL